ncbi:glucan 1,3-beta-glucosidase I/II [Schizosaccharomyces cryophilus OY26]|uniref:glucan 1,3-beta-glucosidase n=1 Tax=Schizosaccharomyces cryophilus (strain OY26 / ATCC MYA-4695 / CBS 11777 / NBRC 106824 / NRRL Y48691) TaxID=653667 RepID=S9XJD5_SCHCR|nr:glucan 1,3-beta-glucosidase I/II [Schizosaccharomyces cryophilus OY26]EPY53761.1 glucan 1,3-beta-glucosidase I/II [Schizosaccharomyces cryophilus OY26]
MPSLSSIVSFLTTTFLLFHAVSAYVIKRNNPVFDYTSEKIRGVNVGGWLLIEDWLNPELFSQFNGNSNAPSDEWGFCETLGKAEAYNQLSYHWGTFFTAEDFARIASWGINAVRIPIGYWAFSVEDNEPYVQGQEFWLDQAIEWSRMNNMKVWVDLHGAPGSQNGFENSGKTGSVDWQKDGNTNRTLQIMSYVTGKYTQDSYKDVVIGIETVNEPLGNSLNMDELKEYDLQVYDMIANKSNSVATIVHDAYVDLSEWTYGPISGNMYNLVMDIHRYQLYESGECSKTYNDHLNSICSLGDQIANNPYITVTGEWSSTLADCTIWNNSESSSSFIGVNSGNITTWTNEYRNAIRLFIETQLDQLERGAGWFYWTAKTGGQSATWDMGILVENGIFPQPLTDRKFSSYCS